MKVSLSWLKELVEYNLSPQQLAEKLSLCSIGVKELTNDYIELDLTYNRGDLLSLRGVAREVAATVGSKLKFQDAQNPYNKILQLQKNVIKTPVTVEDEKLCPVYCIAKIEGLKSGPSPKEWMKKLEDCGMRTVNNVADVTNLIMLEYGQPMHAFDARGVKDETLIVRTAKKGERITTLDGKTRDLDTSDLLIADPLNALGIAGVMGGKDSEVSDTTTTILLEAAIFDPVSIRNSSKRHGLYSEASKRFQHGLTKTNLLQALSAAIKMYEDLGGRLTAINLVGDFEEKPKTVTLTLEKVNSLLGVNIPADQIESSLKKLGFSLGGVSGPPPRWDVTIPYWRLDIDIEEDLIEEVARMYGYEKIEARPLEGKLPQKLDQTLPNFIHDLKKKLAEVGLTEVQTYSFYSTNVLENLQIDKSKLVKVTNPISSETEYMRDQIWPNLVEVVGKNLRQGFTDIAIFELGKVYLPQTGGLPKEPYRLAIALMNGSDNPIEKLYQISLGVNLVHPPGVQVQTGLNYFHPKRFATVKRDGKTAGFLAEVHPRVLNKFGVEKRVAILEIDIEAPL